MDGAWCCRYGLVGRNGVGKTTFLKFLAAARFDGVPPNLQILHIEQEVRTGPMRTGPASRHLPCSPTTLPSYHPTILPAACTLRLSYYPSIPPSHQQLTVRRALRRAGGGER